jgi:hypothetical protein
VSYFAERRGYNHVLIKTHVCRARLIGESQK